MDANGIPSDSGQFFVQALDFIHSPWGGALEEIDAVVKHSGGNASEIGYFDLVKLYFRTEYWDWEIKKRIDVPLPSKGTVYILRDSFDRLVQHGFAIHADDFRYIIPMDDMELWTSYWPRWHDNLIVTPLEDKNHRMKIDYFGLLMY